MVLTSLSSPSRSSSSSSTFKLGASIDASLHDDYCEPLVRSRCSSMDGNNCEPPRQQRVAQPQLHRSIWLGCNAADDCRWRRWL
ncbi:hypothetical protein NL676_038101 [Syzygium grande]|nr:hypothetical protein NL676_038101 [Syzygium grande]